MTTCPESHPFAYYNGTHCCKSGFEKDESASQGEVCDGGPITLESRCCRNDEHIECSKGSNCRNYDSSSIDVSSRRSIQGTYSDIIYLT